MTKRRRKTLTLPLFLVTLSCITLSVVVLIIPVIAARFYGPPTSSHDVWRQYRYSALILWYDGLLTTPADISGVEVSFQVKPGESVDSISKRLEQNRIIRDADALRTYLIYSGLDKTIQAGEYQLNPSMSAIQVAKALQDATPAQVKFVILAGWRMEEIANSLPTSGLKITPEEFIKASQSSPSGLDFLPASSFMEGFFLPGEYSVPRDISANQLVAMLARSFALSLTQDLRDGFDRQGITIYEAVILASIVQREAIVPEEGALISSVFLNRLSIGMKLDSDPTVQYAIGYNETQKTWWTNPLSRSDLQVNSPYNTYLHKGLPPGPISNPGLSALRSVAYPAQTPYYYFRARCDGSGLHSFAETFEQHLNNACP